MKDVVATTEKMRMKKREVNAVETSMRGRENRGAHADPFGKRPRPVQIDFGWNSVIAIKVSHYVQKLLNKKDNTESAQ